MTKKKNNSAVLKQGILNVTSGTINEIVTKKKGIIYLRTSKKTKS